MKTTPRDGPETPRRIAHVFEMGVIGGQFRVVEALALAQHRAGLEPLVLAVASSDSAASHPMLASMEAGGVEVVRLRLPGQRAYLTERREVVRRVRVARVDVVHTHGYRADVVDATATFRAGIPTICTFHGFIGGSRRNRFYELLQRRVARRLDAAVVVSAAMQRDLLTGGFPAKRLHVVPNAVVPAAELLSREQARQRLGLGDGFHVGWIGRISPEKGPDVLIDAIAGLEDPTVGASFIGSGVLQSALQERTEAAGLPIRWHGVVQSAEKYLRAFDAVVLSSRSEGTPMVLLEAMAAGVPVVATRVGGIPDVVSEREAFLVESEDPAALGAAIAAVRRDPGEARSRAAAAGSRLERHFRPEEWVEGYQRVYRAAMKTPRSRR